MKIEILKHGDASRELDAWAHSRPFYATDWHRKWSREDHAQLLLRAMEGDAHVGTLIVARDGDGIRGAATWKPFDWDRQYFGLAHARFGVLAANDADAATELVARGTADMAAAGIAWGATMVDARAKYEIAALQAAGWRVVWACMKMICDTARANTSATVFHDGELEVVPTIPEHVPRLVEAANRLRGTHWLQTLDELPIEKRNAYVGELTRNCCQTDFADVNLTLLRGGVPIGHNASKIFTAPDGVTELTYTFERNTFIDPALQSSGYGRFLERAVVCYLQPGVRLLTGRVRIEAPGMFRILENAGFESRGGELTFARRF